MPSILPVVAAILINGSASIRYISQIFARKTEPHAYTWFVWLLTQSIGVAGIVYGGGGLGALPLTVGCFWLLVIFLLSLRYGTKNVTRGDAFALAAALVAVGLWIFLKSPLLAVLAASAIDMIGFIPSYRKAWEEPWSETVWTWTLYATGNICSLFALSTFSFITATYLFAILAGNAGMAVLCTLRRGVVKRPRGR